MDHNQLTNNPECSHGTGQAQSSKYKDAKNISEIISLVSQETEEERTQAGSLASSSKKSLTLLSVTLNQDDLRKFNIQNVNVPLYIIRRPKTQDQTVKSSPVTTSTPSSSPVRYSEPQSLFILALRKVNKNETVILSSIEAIQEHLSQILGVRTSQLNVINLNKENNKELAAPDSCGTSAPPSYSYVLRQMQARTRRPRLMGTFIPSPSFIPQCPPPTYAACYDIYIDNAVNRQPLRVYNFGFTPMMVVCPECGYAGMTVINTKITMCTHLCAFILCIFCCWVCVPLPYVLTVCKDVYHYCRECRNFLGMYCPTNTTDINTVQRTH